MSNDRAIEQTREEIRKAERGGSALLWFGVLAGPAAWSTQMVVNYNMEESFLCAPAMGEGRGFLFGMELGWWITLFNSILLLVALAGLAAAYACWKKTRDGDPGTTGDRASWMATAGVIVSVTFSFIVAVGFAPVFFLDPCQSPL